MKKQFEIYIGKIYNTEKDLQKTYTDEQISFIHALMNWTCEVMKTRCTFIECEKVDKERYDKLVEQFNKSEKKFDNRIPPKGLFILDNCIYSSEMLEEFDTSIHPNYKELYSILFALKVSHLSFHNIQSFLSYQYTKNGNNGKFVNLVRNISIVEGSFFWSNIQQKLVNSWLENDKEKVEIYNTPKSLDLLLNFGDIRYVRSQLNKVIEGLKDDFVLDEFLSFTPQAMLDKLDELKYILHKKEKRCPLIKINIEDAKNKNKKDTWLKFQKANCGNCQDVRESVEQLNTIVQQQKEYSVLLKSTLKSEIDKISFTKDSLYKVDYRALFIEILYNWNKSTEEKNSAFSNYLFTNTVIPLIPTIDLNSLSQFAKLNETLKIKDEDKKVLKRSGLKTMRAVKEILEERYELFLAGTLRQTTPEDVKNCLDYNYINYKGDFLQKLEIALIEYEKDINIINLKYAKEWLEVKNIAPTTVKITNNAIDVDILENKKERIGIIEKHTKHLEVNNKADEEIMNSEDYKRLKNYLIELTTTKQLPKNITPFGIIKVNADSLRYSIHMIHINIFGKKHHRSLFIDFLYKAFPKMFSNIEPSTMNTKFGSSKKPKSYPY